MRSNQLSYPAVAQSECKDNQFFLSSKIFPEIFDRKIGQSGPWH